MQFRTTFINNKKGSSLINVLIAIAVMLILSSTLLMITVKNSKFSKMVISKSDEYYDLEVAAENFLKEIDKRIEDAEIKSLDYMKEEDYKAESVSSGTMEIGKQEYFNNKYNSLKGNKELDKFIDEAFGRVYYVNLQKIFEDGKHEINQVNVKKKHINIDFWTEHNKPYGSIERGTAWDEFKPEEGDTIFRMKVKDDKGKILTVAAKARVPVYDTTRCVKTTEALRANPIWTNAITAKGSIKFLGANSNIHGDIFSIDNKPNIYTSITRNNRDGILAEDSKINIYGNIYSRGDFHITSDKQKSILNVYKDSDISKSNMKRRCKNFVFDNQSYYELDSLNSVKSSIYLDEINKYTDGENGKNFPFIFKDHNGGNVYCNNLSIENSALQDSSISIKGNVWTNGSVINDSLYGKTKIQINGIYVGLTSVESDGKYNRNRGSCIVNNIYNTKDKLENMNKIELKDRLIVPGVNFIDEIGGNKYKTGESVTSNFWDKDKIIALYEAKGGGNVKLNFRNAKDENGKKVLQVTGVDKLIANIKPDQLYRYFFKNIYDDKNPQEVKKVITNIYLTEAQDKNKIRGYIEGAAVLVKDGKHRFFAHNDLERFSEEEEDIEMGYFINNYDDTKDNYVRLEGILKKIFEDKTIKFGTANRTFENSLDTSIFKNEDESTTGIKFLNGGGELNINGEEEKIIYSDGDLNITGSGKLNGAIICNGNVNIKGNVDIIYDEEVIKKRLKNYENARKFFKPGETGKYCITMETIEEDQKSRKKKSSITYKITEWKKGGK